MEKLGQNNKLIKWTVECYHKPADLIDENTWNLEEAIDDLKLIF